MKTIQLKRIVCLLGLLLPASNLAGQKVITNHPSANGYPVIDLTELSPLGCLLTAAEVADRQIRINQQIPSNAVHLKIGRGVSSSDGIWNAKMSFQFQVMRVSHTVGATDWANAYNVCIQYKEEGGTAGQWRLPTQREQMMIWALQPQLQGRGGFVAGDLYGYWNLSERLEETAWYLDLRRGYCGATPKTDNFGVRCIRDLK